MPRRGIRQALRPVTVVATTAFRADPWRAVGSLVLDVLNQVSTPLLALWLKLFADSVQRGDRGQAITVAVLASVLSIGVPIVCGWASFTMRLGLEERTGVHIDAHLIELSAGLPGIEHHERPEYVDELERLRTQRNQLSQAVSALLVNAAMVAQLSLTVALLAGVHPVLLLLPVFAVPSLLAGGKAEALRQRALEATTERTRLATHLYETATTAASAKELRIFGVAGEIEGRHQAVWGEVTDELVAAETRGAVLSALGWLVFAAGYVGALVLVVSAAVDGRATAGDVLLTATLTAQMNQRINWAVQTVAWAIMTLKTVGRYVWLIDYAERARSVVDDPRPVPERLNDGIRLEGVSFRYPGTDRDVLEDVDLHLPAGATVAIVGDNGAGKTTLVKLLSRFYQPTTGRILVDAVDLARFDPTAWRARTSAGFQDFARLEVIARETVGVGDLPRVDDVPAVEAALVRAGASDVVEALPAGLESQLGKSFETGVDLSGGQWQKLALGRAMMREAPLLLLLDEPTANLDAQTEHGLFERYAGAARRVAAANGSITLLVSHRFSTVRMADLILVLDAPDGGAGRVVEAGSHDELIERGGLYAELYELQARAYR